MINHNNRVIRVEEIILVIDNGCDQSIIGIDFFLIQDFSSIHYNVGRVLNTINSSTLELISKVFNLVSLPNNDEIIFQINQAFLDRDPLQTETLLQPYQARSFGTIVDNCTWRYISSAG